MPEEKDNPVLKLAKKKANEESKTASLGWDDPDIQSKPYYCNPKPGSVCLVRVDFSEVVDKIPKLIKRKDRSEVAQLYWFLKKIQFENILEETGEDFDFSNNLVWQFPKGVAQALLSIFDANDRKGSGHVLVYRITERRGLAKKLEPSEVDVCLKMKREELIEKYFKARNCG